MKKFFSTVLLGTVAATATAIEVDFDKITHWTGHGPNRAALVVCNDAGASDPNAYVWGYRWEDGESPDGDDMFRAVCANSDELVLLTQVTGVYGSTVCGIGFGNAEKLLENIYYDFDKAKESEFINFDYYNSSSLFGQKDAPGDDTPRICQAAIDAARLTGSHLIQHPLDHPAYGYPAYDYDCWLLKDEGADFGWWTSAWYEGYWSYWTATSQDGEWMYSGTGFSGRKLHDGCVDAWSFTMFEHAMVGGLGEGTPPPDDASRYSYRPFRDSSGIAPLGAEDNSDSAAVYYNLSGQKVATPDLAPGIYVKKQGVKTEKILIK